MRQGGDCSQEAHAGDASGSAGPNVWKIGESALTEQSGEGALGGGDDGVVRVSEETEANGNLHKRGMHCWSEGGQGFCKPEEAQPAPPMVEAMANANTNGGEYGPYDPNWNNGWSPRPEGVDVYGSDVCGNGGCKSEDEFCRAVENMGKPCPRRRRRRETEGEGESD